MAELLRARPTYGHVLHRVACVPPCYELFKPDVNLPLARTLAETYNLKSSGLIVNQNAASTQYLSFRYILPDEPFRYLDISIGLDQIEIVFSNPATMRELLIEVGRVWNIVIEALRPNLKDNYFEATLHCTSEGSTKAFLNNVVGAGSTDSAVDDIRKGFSLTRRATKLDASARLGLELSEGVPDGLYVKFAFVSKETMRDLADLHVLFEATLESYRSLQTLAQIELLEPA